MDLITGAEVAVVVPLDRESFRHGPGVTGARLAANSRQRLMALCSNMFSTMASTTGVAR